MKADPFRKPPFDNLRMTRSRPGHEKTRQG